MTDPEMADATYIEPLTFEACRSIIERERPDVLLPTLGGQTALNLAIELSESGVLEEFGVRLIGVDLKAIRRAEDRSGFKQLCEEAGFDTPRSASCTRWTRRCARSSARTTRHHPPVVHAGRKRQWHGAHARRLHPHHQDGIAEVPGARGADRRIRRGMEGIRARGDA
jgi:carbamoylphosphate synthase large subunit